MKISEQKVILTNGIPQCPYCNKPTKREGGDIFNVTCAYYPPSYDENGINTNPDRNSHKTSYTCLECNNYYSVSTYADRSEWHYID